jgi:hypothetical protein
MKFDYESSVMPPHHDSDVATVPYWVCECIRFKLTRKVKLLAVAVGVLAVALIVAIVWR